MGENFKDEELDFLGVSKVRGDIVMLMNDLNTKVVPDRTLLEQMMRKHFLGDRNINCEDL